MQKGVKIIVVHGSCICSVCLVLEKLGRLTWIYKVKLQLHVYIAKRVLKPGISIRSCLNKCW